MPLLSLICLGLGLGLAAGALRVPQRSALLERTGGSLIVIGLGLLGSGLPLFR
ncbi:MULTISPECIES: hypothetical protein [Methylobacterium]|jgi:hypothetical protein|uniref:XapX domain-containing protein n=1 Tax=Methylobacterium longum TaxID=767694 RepID=A0ABT8AU08_9HYPH|nr:MULTISPECIES: hypothetical protein [Methylobacterium]MCJ2099696.1 hypothetical protein [Methylobacterium sp. E-046]MDN3573147.1 hypothetical protein [Methylobacterium longum]GJE13685.1 hypothetical protein FOHLNKBM_4749 [Methylobacterium longum]